MLTKMFHHRTRGGTEVRCWRRHHQQEPSGNPPCTTGDDAQHHKAVRRALLDLERHSAENDDRLARLAAAITARREPPRTSPEAIAKLPRTRILPGVPGQPSEDSSCGICCDSLVNSGRIMLTTLPCGHVYHTTCIVRWLNRSNVCPECRYELETMDASYEAGRLERMKDRKGIIPSPLRIEQQEQQV